MRKTILMLSLMLSPALQAGPVLSGLPTSGAVAGAPGDTVGWGVIVQADTAEWVSATSSFPIIQSNPGLGTYTDLVGGLGGPDGGLLPPGPAPWIVGWDPIQMIGLGAYAIDPSAPLGSFNSGTIRVLLDTFSDDPRTCSTCWTGQVEWDLPFSVSTIVIAPPASSAPEPGALLLSLGGGLCLGGCWRRTRYRKLSTR